LTRLWGKPHPEGCRDGEEEIVLPRQGGSLCVLFPGMIQLGSYHGAMGVNNFHWLMSAPSAPNQS
jgi:hypothetical protein